MTLGYKQTFADGTHTYFKEKILHGVVKGLVQSQSEIVYDDLLPLFTPKITSIRLDPTDRWPPSTDLIHHVYGNRTKNRQCFLVSSCVSVQKINIYNSERKQFILVDGRMMDDEQKLQIAINDGFDSLEHFFTWFQGTFRGKIIHFTKLRY